MKSGLPSIFTAKDRPHLRIVGSCGNFRMAGNPKVIGQVLVCRITGHVVLAKFHFSDNRVYQELRTEGWRDLANSMKFDLARRKLPFLDSPEFPEKAKSERAE